MSMCFDRKDRTEHCLNLPYTVESFDTIIQDKFRSAIASAGSRGCLCEILKEHVAVTYVSPTPPPSTRRRLHEAGIKVGVSISMQDQASTSRLSLSDALQKETLNEELAKVGVEPVSSVSIVDSSQDSDGQDSSGSSTETTGGDTTEGNSEDNLVAVPVVLTSLVLVVACIFLLRWKFLPSRAVTDEGEIEEMLNKLDRIDPSNLTLESDLGRGASSRVKGGTLKVGTRKVTVAVKMMISVTGASEQRQFTNEVNNLVEASKFCSGVTKFYGVCSMDDTLCIVMKLYPKTIAGVLRENPNGLPTEKVIKYTLMLLRTLAELHEKGIVHRDLKPENIILSKPDDPTSVKIVDFGLACKVKGKYYGITKPAGTPGYLPPEALVHKANYGMPSDIWAVGVITYILLCGYPPFYGESDVLLFQDIRRAQVEFDEAEWGPVSQNAKDFIKSIFKKDPTKRPTASELLQDPWFKDNKSAQNCDLGGSVAKLKKTRARIRMQKCVKGVIFANRCRHLSSMIQTSLSASKKPTA